MHSSARQDASSPALVGGGLFASFALSDAAEAVAHSIYFPSPIMARFPHEPTDPCALDLSHTKHSRRGRPHRQKPDFPDILTFLSF